ncbi:MAG TPA: XdhC/CoxI family protein [Ilumatobacteraceae bacterium]|nr:XdhC/CoxI family protein [Ilumatobacteraceae bacterium]HRB01820.1 XdhC/CoxI family protein [Ilumatobacteraceae bacterium]
MDHRLIRELLAAVDRGEPVVLVTVVDTQRSVPRHAGSKMLVYASGSTSGTVGGGEMEARVRAEAALAHLDGRPRLLRYDLIDPVQGDPGVCGGEVHLYLEPHMPPPTVYVIGCGHVGAAVVQLAHWMGMRVIAYDDRAELVTDEAVPLADARLSGDIAAALQAVPVTADTHLVVVTRNVALDLQLLPALLATNARSIGVMGSRRRWDTTSAALRQRGVTDERLARVSSPIGLDLHAETPEEIAVSILAEIVSLRRTGT